MTSPDQALTYLSKRKEISTLVLEKIRRASLLKNSENNIVYLIKSFFNKDKKQAKLNLEEDNILYILQENNILKIISKYSVNDDLVYNIKILTKDFETNLLQVLNKKNSIKQNEGEPIKKLILKPERNSKTEMKIIINDEEDSEIDVNAISSIWSLLYKIAQGDYIEYNPSEHKHIIHYLNKGKDCRFYSKNKYKPTQILKVKNSIIKLSIPIKIKK